MSEYEAAALFVMFAEAAQTAFANYLAIMSAMVAISWFFAHKLNRAQSAIVLTIFSLFAGGFINELVSVYSDFARLGAHLHAMGQIEASQLGWLGPVRADRPDSMAMIPRAVLVMTVMCYLAAVWFFFLVRRQKRIPENEKPA
ncbi:hypothetical protein [Maricaulis sp. CAU 1757]